MICEYTNRDTQFELSGMFPLAGPEWVSEKKILTYQVPKKKLETKVAKIEIDPESFIKLELSYVREVEEVFVTHVSQDGNKKLLRVLVVINERNPEVQARIYPLELAVMDEYPQLRFDFHILSRMNRELKEVLNCAGKNVFKR